MTASKYISKLTWSRPPSESLNSDDHGLQVYHQTHTMTASKCISIPAQSLLPRASPTLHTHSPLVCLQTDSITTSKSLSILARSQPPSVSPNSLHYSILTRSMPASVFISMLARLRCDDTVQLESRQPSMNTPPHFAWYRKEICETEWF